MTTTNPVIVVGFTATRRALRDEEREWVEELLRLYYRPRAQFHHGDCVGGDAYGFEVARNLGYRTVAHPPNDNRYRAHTTSDVVMPPLDYLERNRQIVLHCGILVAVPAQPEHSGRGSGTWMTVRYARDRVKGRIVRNWWIEKDPWLDRRLTRLRDVAARDYAFKDRRRVL